MYTGEHACILLRRICLCDGKEAFATVISEKLCAVSEPVLQFSATPLSAPDFSPSSPPNNLVRGARV
jgi:hypothetical protein